MGEHFVAPRQRRHLNRMCLMAPPIPFLGDSLLFGGSPAIPPFFPLVIHPSFDIFPTFPISPLKSYWYQKKLEMSNKVELLSFFM